ncbi:MAG: pectinesterase family protein [bacterium]
MIFVKPLDNLAEILASAAPNSVVHLAEGHYFLKSTIRTRGLTLEGEGMYKTVITWDDYAEKRDEQGREYVTFRTFTMAVCADGVTLRDLAIENTAGAPEVKGQEVALTVYGDDFTCERCRLTSTQDTLFAGPLPPDLIDRYEGFLPDELRLHKRCRQVYRDCLIEGTVDFIFGCGEALFENCELRSLVDARGNGYIAAPAHGLDQKEGFTFRRCRITAAPGVAEGSIWLARPWRDYGLARFEDCAIGPHIAPLGFDKWNDTHRDETCRFSESPAVAGRVPWCNLGR